MYTFYEGTNAYGFDGEAARFRYKEQWVYGTILDTRCKYGSGIQVQLQLSEPFTEGDLHLPVGTTLTMDFE